VVYLEKGALKYHARPLDATVTGGFMIVGSKSGSLSGSGLVPRPALDGGPAFRTPLSATRTVDLREGADFDPDPDSDSDPDLEPTIMEPPVTVAPAGRAWYLSAPFSR